MLLTLLSLLSLGQGCEMMRPPLSRVELRSFAPVAGTCRFTVDVLVAPGRDAVRPRAAKAKEAFVYVMAGKQRELLTSVTSSDDAHPVDGHGRVVIEVPTEERCLLVVSDEQVISELVPTAFGGPAGAYEVVVYLAPTVELEKLLEVGPSNLDDARAFSSAMPLIEAWLARSPQRKKRRHTLSMTRDSDGNNVEVFLAPIGRDREHLRVTMKRDFTSPVAVDE